MTFSCTDDDGINSGQKGKNSKTMPALSGNEIRIVSYNLLFERTVPSKEEQQWSNRVVQVKRLFTECNFDIIGTQEALTFQVDNVLELSEFGRLGGDIGTGGLDRPMNENEALFYRKSRFEVLDSGNIWFSLTPDKPGSYGWDATYPRMCTWGKFKEKTTGKIFYVYNSHFHVSSPLSRVESAKIIMSKIKEVKDEYPVFCTGDFNDIANSEALQIFLSDGTLLDSREVAKEKIGSLGTFHGFSASYTTKTTPSKRIDFVLATDKVEIKKYEVVDEELDTHAYGSDHMPVVVDAVLK